MKTRAKCALCCLIALLLVPLSGCQLAQADKGADAAQDRMIGVFVTTGHPVGYDLEGSLLDALKANPNGDITIDGNAQTYQGRRYATQKNKTMTDETGKTSETDTYAFEDIGGMSYFEALVPATAERDCCYTTIADDGVSDRKTSVAFGPENSTTLEGTIYVSTGRGEVVFYFNPVYQDAGGRVYTTAGGFGSQANGEDGEKLAQTMNATQTVTEKGKVKKDSTSVTINVQVMDSPKKIAVLQMDANNAVLSRAEFTPGTLPKQITPEQAADYIVLETTQSSADGKEKVTRKLVGKDAQTLESFWCREDGICVKQTTQVLWPDAAALPVS